MARVLHTADTHLGYRQYRLDERGRDFAEAFHEVISAAIEHEVDAVVHAGDLFHTSRPGITPLQTVLTELQRLQRADIPFLLIVGNHERTHDRNWVELLEEVGLATRLDTEGERVADTTFYGLDYVPKGQRDRLNYQFEPCDTDSATLVGHGLFTPFGHGDWETRDILSKSPVDFDIVLVGDDHGPKHESIHTSTEASERSSSTAEQPNTDGGSVPISYAGSTERTKADQRRPRTYSLVTIPSDRDIDPEEHIDRQEIDSAREFVYVDVSLERGQGVEMVEGQIRDEVDDLNGAVLKVTIEGVEEDSGSDVATTENGEPAIHERIPEGPIENLGSELGALITRVGDRRDLFGDEREYQMVEFADIDAAVDERRRGQAVSEPADELLDMALATEEYVDSNLKDTAQNAVANLVDQYDLRAFHVDGGDVGTGEGATPDPEKSDIAIGEEASDEAEPSPEDLLEELHD